MNKKFIFILMFVFPLIVSAQVTIGAGVSPDENAILDLKTEPDGSSSKGFLLPRVSLVSLDSPQPITSGDLIESIVVYNTNELVGGRGIYYWKDKKWNNLSSEGNTNDNTWNKFGTDDAASLNSDDIYHQGKIGIGINNPTNNLHVKGTNPIKIEGLGAGEFDTSSMLSINANNVVEAIPSSTISKTIGTSIANATSIPVPNVYTLSKNLTNFLRNAKKGESQVLTELVETKSAIKGMTFNPSNSTIFFPPGTYQISVVYEAIHNSDCSISSYFVDFPGARRIHSTSTHSIGITSNHGGTIIYTATLTEGVSWQIKIGRGQSGTCIGDGMTLSALSTQVSIFRIGD